MSVARDVAARVADLDKIAIAVAPPAELDPSAADSDYRRSRWRRVVDRAMMRKRAEDWMLARQAERRGDLSVAERRAQKRATHSLTFAVIIGAAAVAGGKIEGVKTLAAGLQFRGRN